MWVTILLLGDKISDRKTYTLQNLKKRGVKNHFEDHLKVLKQHDWKREMGILLMKLDAHYSMHSLQPSVIAESTHFSQALSIKWWLGRWNLMTENVPWFSPLSLHSFFVNHNLGACSPHNIVYKRSIFAMLHANVMHAIIKCWAQWTVPRLYFKIYHVRKPVSNFCNEQINWNWAISLSCVVSIWLQNTVLSKLHPTEAITLRTAKVAQSVSQIQRQKASKSEQFSARCFVKGLAAHTAPFSGLKHRPGLRLSSIKCLVTQTKAYCCGTTLMACGWEQRGPLMTEKEGEWGREKEGASAVQSLLSIMMRANEGMGS